MNLSLRSNIACNCDDERTGLIDDNILMSKDQLPVTVKVLKYLLDIIQYVGYRAAELFKALYFGGSSWNISWLNYVLGPLKCSGKPQSYPSEIEALTKKRREQTFAHVVDQAEINKKNLKVLDDKIVSEADNITNTLENEIDNVEKNLRNQNEEFKEQLKSLTNHVNHLQNNFTETVNRLEKQSMIYFTGLSSRVDVESVHRKVRP